MNSRIGGLLLAVAFLACMFSGAAANDQPSNAEANAAWLRGYESDDRIVKAQVLGVTTGIVTTAKSFIPANECPQPKPIRMSAIADETAKVVRANMKTRLSLPRSWSGDARSVV